MIEKIGKWQAVLVTIITTMFVISIVCIRVLLFVLLFTIASVLLFFYCFYDCCYHRLFFIAATFPIIAIRTPPPPRAPEAPRRGGLELPKLSDERPAPWNRLVGAWV